VRDAELLERMWPSMRAAFTAAASGSGRLVQLDGVQASVVSRVPERSVFNSVLYDEAGALERAYGDIARLYDEAGVRAWTVWVHPGDEQAGDLLRSRGHVLDAEPAAMAVELRDLQVQPAGIEWRPARSPHELAELNDRAYGWGDAFARAFGETLPAAHTYIAELNGDPAACVGSVDAGGDCSIVWVATLPEARGRGLATGLMRQALLDARERGCTTSSLQASRMGFPVYERLGYRRVGSLQMWELRKP
jgi:GNAT superfamily N-acetyltransferase